MEQALAQDEPAFPSLDDGFVDDAASAYWSGDQVAVAVAIGAAADAIVAAAGARTDDRDRGLTVGDARMDVRRLVERCVHDAEHHLDDVARGLRATP